MKLYFQICSFRLNKFTNKQNIKLETAFACCLFCSTLHRTYLAEGGGKTTRQFLQIKTAKVKVLEDIQRCVFPVELHAIHQSKYVPCNSQWTGLCSYLDATQTMRVPLNLEAKHPIILPRTHHATKLLVEDIHQRNGHVGPEHALSLTRECIACCNKSSFGPLFLLSCTSSRASIPVHDRPSKMLCCSGPTTLQS